ncbi:hypothetical protein EV128_13425 [Rhizobium azibense]|nr:hypothetical protein EV128_13425 [Rhizobium azibense]
MKSSAPAVGHARQRVSVFFGFKFVPPCGEGVNALCDYDRHQILVRPFPSDRDSVPDGNTAVDYDMPDTGKVHVVNDG